MSCTGAAKKEKLEGELGGQTPVGKQWGTERKMLGVLRNESEAAQWETTTCFPAKPSLFVFTQGRAFCSLEGSAPISEDSDPRMPGAYPAINHRRTATNTTLTQMFHF